MKSSARPKLILFGTIEALGGPATRDKEALFTFDIKFGLY